MQIESQKDFLIGEKKTIYIYELQILFSNFQLKIKIYLNQKKVVLTFRIPYVAKTFLHSRKR